MVFKSGDIISFTARDGSFGMAKVLKVDTHQELPVPQPVYHVLVYTYRNLIPPNATHLDGAKVFIPHLPILESGFRKSGALFIGFADTTDAELAAYTIWKDAFFSGAAGVFDLSIEEAFSVMLDALKR
jgi:hypothetical protein